MSEIQLTQNRVALVDAEDFDIVNPYSWHVCNIRNSNLRYAGCMVRNGDKQVTFLMHRMILNTPKGTEVDHINGDGLDNRRANLRVCKHSENLCNQKLVSHSSQFKGVYWNKEKLRWRVRIKINRKEKHLGYYDSEEEAGRAYDIAARINFGEFARTNF